MSPLSDPDSELMMSIRSNDAQSFGVLLDRHRHVVVHHLTRIVQNEAIAEELAQDVFLRVFRSRERYRPTAKFSTWLFRITANVAFNHFRDHEHEKRNVSLNLTSDSPFHREPVDIAPLAEERLIEELLARHVRRAVGALPPKQRAAVIMHRYDEMNYAEIARKMQTTPCAVKALVFRAHETLRWRLGHLQASSPDRAQKFRRECSAPVTLRHLPVDEV